MTDAELSRLVATTPADAYRCLRLVACEAATRLDHVTDGRVLTTGLRIVAFVLAIESGDRANLARLIAKLDGPCPCPTLADLILVWMHHAIAERARAYVTLLDAETMTVAFTARHVRPRVSVTQ